MCLGDTICLQVKLISALPEEKQLWVSNFREEKGKMMNLLYQIAREIADETKIKLTPEELEQLLNVRQHQPDLLEACFKGRFYMNQLTKEGLELGSRPPPIDGRAQDPDLALLHLGQKLSHIVFLYACAGAPAGVAG